MLRFYGFDLELWVEQVLDGHDGPAVCSGRDFTGRPWVIAQVDDDPAHLAWLCAEVSERALRAVLDGRASAIDALRHSATGTAELVTVDHGRAVPDQCLLGGQVDEHLHLGERPRLVALAA
jgi:hypothetical protein